MSETSVPHDGATTDEPEEFTKPGTQPSVSTLKETELAGFGATQARLVYEDRTQQHLDQILREWRVRTAERLRLDTPALLGILADLGFAWRDIARMVNVSVPAVQKWRRGSSATGQNRQALAALVAACDLITEHYLVQNIASWFEAPVVGNAPVTPIDLYEAKAVTLVFQHATGNTDPEEILTTFQPDWRETYRSEFEVFTADDGHLALRVKGR